MDEARIGDLLNEDIEDIIILQGENTRSLSRNGRDPDSEYQ